MTREEPKLDASSCLWNARSFTRRVVLVILFVVLVVLEVVLVILEVVLQLLLPQLLLLQLPVLSKLRYPLGGGECCLPSTVGLLMYSPRPPNPLSRQERLWKARKLLRNSFQTPKTDLLTSRTSPHLQHLTLRKTWFSLRKRVSLKKTLFSLRTRDFLKKTRVSSRKTS